MQGHFRAFSFVDRITSVEPGVRIRGSYTIPSDISEFPSSLVSEAVGQLAAWCGMAAVDFKKRPVAGIAGQVDFLKTVHPGQTLELSADLQSADAEAAAYSGSACVDGAPVIQLQWCVGPMLPVEDFDDPQLVRERFAFLRDTGAAPGGFAGLPALTLEPAGGETGKTKRAVFHVPGAGGFFVDHFPRRPVFPGALLMHVNLKLAAALASEAGHSTPRTISNVKFRAFTPPGETLEIEAKFTDATHIAVETRKGKKLVGNARLRLDVKEKS